MKVLRASLALSALFMLAALQSSADEIAVSHRASEIAWEQQAKPEGAVAAQLWTYPSNGDSGRLFRWPAKARLDGQVRTRDTHFVVLAGTFVVMADESYHELGPGGFAEIPRDVEHAIGCAASGTCTFLMHVSEK